MGKPHLLSLTPVAVFCAAFMCLSTFLIVVIFRPRKVTWGFKDYVTSTSRKVELQNPSSAMMKWFLSTRKKTPLSVCLRLICVFTLEPAFPPWATLASTGLQPLGSLVDVLQCPPFLQLIYSSRANQGFTSPQLAGRCGRKL